LHWNPQSVLSSSLVFDFFQSLVGSPQAHQKFLANYAQPKIGEHLLDIGCGFGATLRHLPEGIRYTGIDISEAYINAARARFPNRGTFIPANVAEVTLERGQFDRAIAVGVIHHLDDAAAHSLLQLARSTLRPGCPLITIDPCYTPEQSSLGRFLTSKDRGKFVRDAAGYRKLFDAHGRSEILIVRGMLRVPYIHLIAKINFDSNLA
jgi:cyclopropane fatty-acyl-phospholipid synthase-like methyltransferase